MCAGNYEFPVAPLDLPPLVPGTAPAPMAASPAVALFVEWAQAADLASAWRTRMFGQLSVLVGA